MGKKKSGRIDLGAGPGGAGRSGTQGGQIGSQQGSLTHNPFAALQGGKIGSTVDSPAGTEPAPPKEAVLFPTGAQVIVRHERKGHGGKTVTVVDLSRTGISNKEALGALAKDLRKALGVGARAQGDTITVQGELVERVAVYFREHFQAHVTLGTR